MNEITIYSDIGESYFGEGTTDQSIKDQLDAMQGDVTVRINSGGGDVFHGFAIYNLLKQHDGKITIKIDGLAASSASVIAMAGDDIQMGEASMLMIHNPWTIALGDSADMIKTAERLDQVKASILNVYALNTSLSVEELTVMMDEETWFTADEAISNGFASEQVAGGKMKSESKAWIRNAPKPVQEPVTEEQIIEEIKTPLLKIAAKARLLELA